MRTKIRMTIAADQYSVAFTPSQREAVAECIALVQHLQLPDKAIALQAGCSKSELGELLARVRSGESTFPGEELHTMVAVLAVAPLAFPPSEEAFHSRIGFYREDVAELARELISAFADLNRDGFEPAG